MAIEIVDSPIEHGDFPIFSIVLLVYQRVVYKPAYNLNLVGGVEPWNFMTYHRECHHPN